MYRDRLHAGQELAVAIKKLRVADPVLLAVPRGGVIVAKPIADALKKPLQILITRKLGHPRNPEVAIGAVMPDGSAVIDEHLTKHIEVDDEYIAQAISSEMGEIQRRMLLYTGHSKAPAVEGRTAVIIDDGIATGYTIKAAVKWLKRLGPKEVLIAVPVAPPEVVSELRTMVEEVICPFQPEPFWSVGQFYEQFPQNSDEEVISILHDVQTFVQV